MRITTILFDLDGTLLPMDQDVFVKAYFGGISKRLAVTGGYNPEALVSIIWKGTIAMMKNDGSRPNERVFWEVFAAAYGEKKATDDQALFDDFYAEDFDKVQASCGYTPASAKLIGYLKERGINRVLATNPIFPAVATQARIRWAGLSPDDFLTYTTYENSRYCKPNPAYYQDILDKIGVPAEACLMVGNDVDDDLPAETLGMKVFLLTDCLINKKDKDVSRYPRGSFEDLRRYIDELI